MNKYKLSKKRKDGLRRIIALRDIPSTGVEKGDLGGLLKKYHNLSQKGDCWIYRHARVFGYAQVFEHAQVYEQAWVYGHARVHGQAQVFEDARVHGYARVYGHARVYGGSWTCTPLQIIGGKFTVQVSSPTEISIGCQTRTVGWWRNEENWAEMVEDESITNEEVEELRDAFEYVAKRMRTATVNQPKENEK